MTKDIVLSPVATEKSMLLTERENKLIFVVHRKANKSEIKAEIEKMYDVKVESVRVVISKRGKKAIVKLKDEFSADEVAGRIGLF